MNTPLSQLRRDNPSQEGIFQAIDQVPMRSLSRGEGMDLISDWIYPLSRGESEVRTAVRRFRTSEGCVRRIGREPGLCSCFHSKPYSGHEYLLTSSADWRINCLL
ncbi:MAG: hypothetical protein WD097_09550 [Balneolales bacterium]